MREAAVELCDVSKVYNPGTIHETVLFNHFSLQVEKGSFVSVVGSNGSGKTSMLNIICGTIPVEEGAVKLGGVDMTRMK